MPDVLSLLTDFGAAAWTALRVPVLAWTAVALAVETVLRLTSPAAQVSLWARGATLALLPALAILPPVLAPLVPALAASAPAVAPVGAGPLFLDASSEAALPVVDGGVALGALALVAALVSALALAALAGGVVWLSRTRRALPAADAETRANGHALGTQIGLRRRVEVAVVQASSAPFTIGWQRPLVAVPSELRGESLELALAHELAHVRRSHFGWHLAERAVVAAFVWHPLAHVLSRGLALDRERVADGDVVRLWPDRAARYGRLLAAFSTRPTPGLALGASSSTLIYRLTAMTRLQPDRRPLARFVGAALFLIPLFLATAAIPDAQQVPTPPAPPAVLDDALMQKVQEVSVWRSDDTPQRVRVRMNPGTSSRDATDVADYFSENGDAPADLVVIDANGHEITRSVIRLDAMPPPPPPPPAPDAPPPPPHAPAPDAPPPPPAPPAPAPEALPPPPAPPSAPAPPPPPVDSAR